jgi:NAD(P)-dependent dehydrogenase (short-subunit alcohol dehydrogenase family)
MPPPPARQTEAKVPSEEADVGFTVDRDLLGLEDAVALVTGAGAGLAKATALLLARAGCHVAVADIDLSSAAATADEIEAIGRRATALHADVTNRRDIERMVDDTVRELGPIEVAVNVVGGSGVPPKPFLDLSLAEWESAFRRNAATTFECMQVEAVAMVRDHIRGRIVNFGSSSGVVGAPNLSAYGAANASVIHFTKSAALELGPYGLRVNCVVPGAHWTEKTRATLADPAAPAGLKEFFRAAADAPPLGRMGEPWEAAGVAVFLASNLSSYMTGQSVISDGGVSHTTARPPIGMPMRPKAFGDGDGSA